MCYIDSLLFEMSSSHAFFLNPLKRVCLPTYKSVLYNDWNVIRLVFLLPYYWAKCPVTGMFYVIIRCFVPMKVSFIIYFDSICELIMKISRAILDTIFIRLILEIFNPSICYQEKVCLQTIVLILAHFDWHMNWLKDNQIGINWN